MRLLNLRIIFFIYCGLFVLILVVFCVVSSFTTFRPNFTSGLSSGDLPRPRIGMLSLVTVSPVITAFHSCCLSHHVFDQVNLWPAWVGFETAFFWLGSPGTVETQRRGTADRGVESHRFQVSIVRRKRFQILPKPARGLLGQKRGAIDNNYGRKELLGIRLQDSVFLSDEPYRLNASIRCATALSLRYQVSLEVKVEIKKIYNDDYDNILYMKTMSYLFQWTN